MEKSRAEIVRLFVEHGAHPSARNNRKVSPLHMASRFGLKTVAKALLDLHQATQEARWGVEAERLTRVMIELFWDDDGGAFYTTSHRHERLIARLKDSHDGATPSGNAVAVGALQRLAALTGDVDFAGYAERTLEVFSGQITAQPSAFTEMLLGLDTQLHPPRQIVIVGAAVLAPAALSGRDREKEWEGPKEARGIPVDPLGRMSGSRSLSGPRTSAPDPAAS